MRGRGALLRSRNRIIAVLLVVLVALAALATIEYLRIQSLSNELSGVQTTAEVVYNLPGVAIPVICCPSLASSIVVGPYLFSSSSITPFSSYKVNGTEYPGGNGVMLLFEVAPLSSPSDVENASFVWNTSFNDSAPFPVYSSLFGGAVDFHWYVLDGVLYMHVQTT